MAAANFPAGLGLDFYLADELNGLHRRLRAHQDQGANAHAANRSVKTIMTINAVRLESTWLHRPLGAARFSATVAGSPLAGGGDVWSYTVVTLVSAMLRNGWWIILRSTSACRAGS